MDTPLRRHLVAKGETAEEFADAHNLSAWSVRHWARGNKTPLLANQLELERATDGAVTPAMWSEWEVAKLRASQVPA